MSAGGFLLSIEIPHKSKSKHSAERFARSAMLTVRFGSFELNAPRNHPKHRVDELPDIKMHAIHVLEECPPEGEDAVEWMLLTNLEVSDFEQAREKVYWYSLRWRIEMFFKVLKSGFRVEDCRLAHGERLCRYLTVMRCGRMASVHDDFDRPNQSGVQCCSSLLTDQEWKILRSKNTRAGKNVPADKPPTMRRAVAWIAKLGGHLGRKCDGPPGTTTLWRGWKRLVSLVEGAKLAEAGL